MVDDVISSAEVAVCGIVRLWCICSDCGLVLTIQDRDEGDVGQYNLYVDPHRCKEVTE